MKNLILIFLLIFSFNLNLFAETLYPGQCKDDKVYQSSNEVSNKFDFKDTDFLKTVTDIPLYRMNTEGLLDQSYGDTEEPHIHQVADFNNDGIDDLLIEYTATIVAPVILYGNKNGFFDVLKIQDFDPTAARKSIRKAGLADFNNDGFIDIYGFTTGDHYKELGVSEIDVLLINQNGKGFKSVPVKEPRKNAGNHGGIIIDINNDGWVDIVPLDEGINYGSYPIKNINGNKFELLNNHISDDVKRYWIEDGDAADLNNDGFTDMVVSVEEKSDVHPTKRNKINTMRIIYGDGDFDFKNNKVIKLGTSWIDNQISKKAELIWGNNMKSGTSNINLFDINADGKIDILISEFIDNNITRWKTSGFKAYINKGDCFSDQTNLYFPNQETNRKFENRAFTHFIGNFYHIDIDNDGFKDLVLRNWYDEYSYFTVSPSDTFPFIFMNHDNKKYLPVNFSSAELLKYLHSLTPGDFNGDGKIDLVGIDPRNNGSKVIAFFNKSILSDAYKSSDGIPDGDYYLTWFVNWDGKNEILGDDEIKILNNQIEFINFSKYLIDISKDARKSTQLNITKNNLIITANIDLSSKGEKLLVNLIGKKDLIKEDDFTIPYYELEGKFYDDIVKVRLTPKN